MPRPEARSTSSLPTRTTARPDLDPAGLWSVTDNAIAQDLLFRSLTTSSVATRHGQYVLVPDLATDLGTPNADFTEWTFTLKDGIKWENGDPVTADEVAFGIKRSFDSEHVPDRPRHVVLEPVLQGWRQVHRPLQRRRRLPGRHGRRQRHHPEDGQAVLRDGLLRHLPGHRPGADSTRSHRLRPAPAGHRARTRSRSTCPTRSWCWSRTTSGTPTPTRPVTSRSTSTPSSSTSTTAVAGPDGAQRHRRRCDHDRDRRCWPRTTTRRSPGRQRRPDRTSGRALHERRRCRTTRRSPSWRCVRRSPSPTPTRTPGRPAGELPGVTLANGVTDPDLGFGHPAAGHGRSHRVGRSRSTDETDPVRPRASPRSCWPRRASSPVSYEASWVYDSSPRRARQRWSSVKLGLQGGRLQPEAVPLRCRQPVRRLDRPGQRALQEDQHPRYRVVPGLAVGVDLPAGHRRHR